MTRIVDSYNIRPYELKPSDAMICTVTLHVMSDGTYRMYRCSYRGASMVGGVPQGSRFYDVDGHVAKQLFPTVLNAGLKPDLG